MVKYLQTNELKKSAMFGFVAGLVSLGLTWIIGMLKIPVVNLTFSAVDVNVRDRIIQGIDPSLGGKVLSWMQGFVPISLPSVLGLFVTTFLIVFAGKIAYELIPFKVKGRYARVALIMLYGTVIGSAIVAWSIPAVSLSWIGIMLAMFIYYLIVGAATMAIDQQLKMVKFDI